MIIDRKKRKKGKLFITKNTSMVMVSSSPVEYRGFFGQPGFGVTV